MKQVVIILSIVLFASCHSKQPADVQALQQQNDSLMRLKSQMESETNEYLASMNEIEGNFDKVKEMENYIQVNKSPENGNQDVRTKINDDILLMTDILKKNKEQIAALTHKMGRSAVKIRELQKTVERLNNMLNEKISMIQSLSDELQIKDAAIADLNKNVDNLNQDVANLQTTNKTQQEQISSQDEKLNTAWYVFGSAKELKEQKIITSGGLFSSTKVLQKDFNKEYFVKVDIRQVKSIPLYSKKAKMLTTHPQSSYSIDKVDGSLVLTIKDFKEFWSVSRYLVIQVD
jgi:predicted  nucleic acid-binding Zn-ribbon protein